MTDTTPQLLRVAVLISGGGSSLLNLLQRVADGRLPGVQIVGVAASRVCTGLEHAQLFGIPNRVVPRQPDNPPAGRDFEVGEFSGRLTATLRHWSPDLIVLAGFLSQYLPPPEWRGRVINLHPALLPGVGGAGMYGDRVHEAVLAAGATVSGCTVHVVTTDYDSGPVIAQDEVPVMPGDTPETLGERVRAAERELLPEVISWYADGRLSVDPAGNLQFSAIS